jgi:hypothetical protein
MNENPSRSGGSAQIERIAHETCVGPPDLGISIEHPNRDLTIAAIARQATGYRLATRNSQLQSALFHRFPSNSPPLFNRYLTVFTRFSPFLPYWKFSMAKHLLSAKTNCKNDKNTKLVA